MQEVEGSEAALHSKEAACQAGQNEVASNRLQLEASRYHSPPFACFALLCLALLCYAALCFAVLCFAWLGFAWLADMLQSQIHMRVEASLAVKEVGCAEAAAQICGSK